VTWAERRLGLGAALAAVVLGCSRPASRAAAPPNDLDAGVPTDATAPGGGAALAPGAPAPAPPPAVDDDDPAHPLAFGRGAVYVELTVGGAARVEALPAYEAAVESCFRAVPRAQRSDALPARVRVAPPDVRVAPGDQFAAAGAGAGVPDHVEHAAFTACLTPRIPTIADLARYSDLAAGRIALAFVAVAYTRAADARAAGHLETGAP